MFRFRFFAFSKTLIAASALAWHYMPMHVVWGHVAEKLCWCFGLESTKVDVSWSSSSVRCGNRALTAEILHRQRLKTSKEDRGTSLLPTNVRHHRALIHFTSKQPLSNWGRIMLFILALSTPHPSPNPPPPPPTSNPIVLDSSKIWEQTRVPG